MNISLMMAITADGKIGKTSDHLADWTSKADKKIFVKKTKEAGVIIMGRATYDTIGRPLPGRLTVVITRNPDDYENIPGTLLYTNKTPQQIIAYLSSLEYSSAMICGGAQINSLFIKEKLISEIFLTIEPKLFGNGISLFSDSDLNIDLELKNVEKIGDNSIFCHYVLK